MRLLASIPGYKITRDYYTPGSQPWTYPATAYILYNNEVKVKFFYYPVSFTFKPALTNFGFLITVIPFPQAGF